MGDYLILYGPNTGKVLYLNWCDTKDHMQDKDGDLYYCSDICEVGCLEEYKNIYLKEMYDAKTKLNVIMYYLARL